MADVPEMLEVQDALVEPTDLAQIERERAMIAEADAQFERGEFYDFDVVAAWMDALETDPQAKLPPYSSR